MERLIYRMPNCSAALRLMKERGMFPKKFTEMKTVDTTLDRRIELNIREFDIKFNLDMKLYESYLALNSVGHLVLLNIDRKRLEMLNESDSGRYPMYYKTLYIRVFDADDNKIERNMDMMEG